MKRLQTKAYTDNQLKKLYFRCFRRFSILADGKELKLKWRTNKALELMSYLISEKGLYISKEKIAEALWPKYPSEKAISKLYLAYYYIKKQEKFLGVNFPIESERGKMRIVLDQTDCDLIEFDHLIAVCKKVDENNIMLAERAEGLYCGGLFEDNYYEWNLIAEQQYEILYEELLKKIIQCHKESGNTSKEKHYSLKLEKLYA